MLTRFSLGNGLYLYTVSGRIGLKCSPHFQCPIFQHTKHEVAEMDDYLVLIVNLKKVLCNCHLKKL